MHDDLVRAGAEIDVNNTDAGGTVNSNSGGWMLETSSTAIDTEEDLRAADDKAAATDGGIKVLIGHRGLVEGIIADGWTRTRRLKMQCRGEKRTTGAVAGIDVPAVRATRIEIYGKERVAGSGVKDQQIGN